MTPAAGAPAIHARAPPDVRARRISRCAAAAVQVPLRGGRRLATKPGAGLCCVGRAAWGARPVESQLPWVHSGPRPRPERVQRVEAAVLAPRLAGGARAHTRQSPAALGVVLVQDGQAGAADGVRISPAHLSARRVCANRDSGGCGWQRTRGRMHRRAPPREYVVCCSALYAQCMRRHCLHGARGHVGLTAKP